MSPRKAPRPAGRITERQLGVARQEYERLLDAIPVATWVLDRDLRFLRVYGPGWVVPPREMIGRTMKDLLGAAGGAEGVLERYEAALRGQSQLFDYCYMDRIWEVRLGPLRDARRRVVGVLGLGVDVTQRRRDEAALRASRAELRDLADRLRTVREGEQRRIAREIHDQIAGSLSLLRVEIAYMKSRLPPGADEPAAIAGNLLAATADLLAAARRISSELRSPLLENVSELGLAAVLRALADEIGRRTGLAVAADVDLGDEAIDPRRCETAYQVAREAMTNAVSHAGARRILLRARIDGGALHFAVEDDGRGLEAGDKGDRHALGLLGIRERVLACAGEVSIGAAPSGGTRVEVRLPPTPARGGAS